MKRTLRRRCIIREYDFNKILKKDPDRLLYDSYEFEPFTKLKLEQEAMWHTLKGTNTNNWLIENPPISNLRRLQDSLYDKKYLDWDCWHTSEGFVLIQSRKNAPQTRLGWATMTKNFTNERLSASC
jgi:hypothetical protein